MQFVGNSSDVTNPDLNIQHTMVAMYLGYKNNLKGPDEPQLVKKLKVTLIFSCVFFLYFDFYVLISFNSFILPISFIQSSILA
jgi:hypothetical protein